MMMSRGVPYINRCILIKKIVLNIKMWCKQILLEYFDEFNNIIYLN